MLRLRLILPAALAVLLALPVSAAEVESDGVLCFSEDHFAGEITGICITGLPEGRYGTVLLGSRVLREGDILTAGQLAQMTFAPAKTEYDREAEISYLPIFADHVAPQDTVTISIRGKENKAPAADDSTAETYKNLPIEGRLDVKEPEGEAMTFTLTRAPRRGEVELREDGSFLYTPKKNKVGIDSFVYTATDAAGKVSREATVTITILKPTDAPQYTDTLGNSCRFAAEWMKNTGIFVGETLDGNACFHPEKTVSRGEFLTMLVRTLEVPVDENATFTGYTDEIPGWLKPYVAAAVRSGLVSGLHDSMTFGAGSPMTAGEAAVMLQNGLDLPVPEEASAMAPDADTRTNAAMQVLNSHGIMLTEGTLTRADAAQILWQASRLAEEAPGSLIFQAMQ